MSISASLPEFQCRKQKREYNWSGYSAATSIRFGVSAAADVRGQVMVNIPSTKEADISVGVKSGGKATWRRNLPYLTSRTMKVAAGSSMTGWLGRRSPEMVSWPFCTKSETSSFFIPGISTWHVMLANFGSSTRSILGLSIPLFSPLPTCRILSSLRSNWRARARWNIRKQCSPQYGW